MGISDKLTNIVIELCLNPKAEDSSLSLVQNGPTIILAVSKHSINKARILQHVYIQITFNTNGKNFITLLTQTPEHLLPYNQCHT